jgi:cation diffusion facilitator family transporter
MLDDETRIDPAAQRLVLASTVASVGLLAGLVAAFVLYGSRLALAQAADSFSDIFTASALLISVRIAAQPADEEHPLGHQRAEPIAALVAAVIAGVLAVEVLRDAIEALVNDVHPEMEGPLLGIFLLKMGIKAAVAVLCRLRHRRVPSPALAALHVDARNDVAVGLVSVVGFFAARYGWAGLDAWFAMPVALYVGWSGVDLARDNIRLLMGEAPPPARRAELVALAAEVPGVRAVHHLLARHHGLELDVLLHVEVDPELTVRQAHDIGNAVERRLLAEPDVCHAVAHVDAEEEPGRREELGEAVPGAALSVPE